MDWKLRPDRLAPFHWLRSPTGPHTTLGGTNIDENTNTCRIQTWLIFKDQGSGSKIGIKLVSENKFFNDFLVFTPVQLLLSMFDLNPLEPP